MKMGEVSKRAAKHPFVLLVLLTRSKQVDRDVLGLEPRQAYVRRGSLWRPSQRLASRIKQLFADERNVMVVVARDQQWQPYHQRGHRYAACTV